jgi:hypothetical protein
VSEARRSIIVMLPGDLIDRLDARVGGDAGGSQRDEALAQALAQWLDRPPPRAVGPAPFVVRPEAPRALAERAAQDLARAEQRGREAVAATHEALARIDRDPARPEAHARARAQAGLAEVHGELGRAASLVEEALRMILATLPALADDARSRWLSGQAGSARPRAELLEGASALDAALAERTQVEIAVHELRRRTGALVPPNSIAFTAAADADSPPGFAELAAPIVAALTTHVAVATAGLEMMALRAAALLSLLVRVPDVHLAC